MDTKQKLKMRGKFNIAVLDENDNLKYEKEVTNTIMNAGLAEVSGLILNDIGGNAFDYLALGTGTTAPTATQTTLVAEKYRSAGTGSQTTTTVSNDTAQLTTSIAMTASDDLTEVGILNSSSTGDLLARTTYSAVTVADGDTVNLGYSVAFS